MAWFIANSSSVACMLTPSHARITNGMTTAMIRFDPIKGRYSNTAPRFPLSVLRIPSGNRHYRRFLLTDACPRTPAPARDQIPPEAILENRGSARARAQGGDGGRGSSGPQPRQTPTPNPARCPRPAPRSGLPSPLVHHRFKLPPTDTPSVSHQTLRP